MPNRATEIRARRQCRTPLLNAKLKLLLNADLVDQAENFGFRDIVKRAQVVFFQALAQIFRSDETCFAVRQVTLSLRPEFDEGVVRQSDHMSLAIDKEFRVNGVGMAGRDAVPHVREAA